MSDTPRTNDLKRQAITFQPHDWVVDAKYMAGLELKNAQLESELAAELANVNELRRINQGLVEQLAAKHEAFLKAHQSYESTHTINLDLKQQIASKDAEIWHLRGQLSTTAQAMVYTQLLHDHRQLQQVLAAKELDLEKWKEGCRVNSENCQEAQLRNDNLRRNLGALQRVAWKLAEDLNCWINDGGFGGNPDKALADWNNLPPAVRGEKGAVI